MVLEVHVHSVLHSALHSVALSALIMSRFMRVTIGQMGGLTRHHMHTLLADVGADVCWRDTIEAFTGVRFDALIQAAVPPAAGNGEQTRTLCNTVSVLRLRLLLREQKRRLLWPDFRSGCE